VTDNGGIVKKCGKVLKKMRSGELQENILLSTFASLFGVGPIAQLVRAPDS
jgi:hypothetical protein